MVSPIRYLPGLWLVFLILIGLWTGSQLYYQDVDRNFISFLPTLSESHFQEASEYMIKGPYAQKITLAFGHTDPEVVKNAVDDFKKKIKNKAIGMREENPQGFHEWKILYTELSPLKEGFLSPSDRFLLEKKGGAQILRRVIKGYLLGMKEAKFDPLDPFGLYTSFWQDLAIQFDGKQYGKTEPIQEGSLTWIIYEGSLQGDPLGAEIHKWLSEMMIPQLTSMENDLGIIVHRQGAAFYGLKGIEEGRWDMATLGMVSLVGTVLLLLLGFGSLRPLFFGCIVIAAGLVASAGVAFLFFTKIYMVSFVFATALIGISIDYALHYTCAWLNKGASQESVLASLYPALPLGMITSVLGYGVMAVSPVPAIAQMAVMGASGLMSAFISVWLWGSYFITSSHRPPLFLARAVVAILTRLAQLGNNKKTRLGVALLCGLAGIWGVLSLTPQDQITKFQELNADLYTQQVKINRLLNRAQEKSVWFVWGNTLEELLENQESLRDLYFQAHPEGVSGHEILGLSSLLPSSKRQALNKALISSQLHLPYEHDLRHFLYLPEDTPTARECVADTQENLLETIWTKSPVLRPWGFSTSQGVMGPIILDPEVGKRLVETEGYRAIEPFVINPLAAYASLFKSYRWSLTGLVIVLLICFGGILSLWKGVGQSIKIVSPLLFVLLGTLGGVIFLNPNFSVFSVMGFIMVTCIGIDYALFLGTASQDERNSFPQILLANGLCALTTFLSFGLLMFAHTAAVADFGRVVFVGIILNVILTSFFLGKRNLSQGNLSI